HRRQRPPSIRIDESDDEPHGTIPEQHIATRPRMCTPHLVCMSKGIVRSMNDDLRMVGSVGATVNTDETTGAVCVAGSRWWRLRRRATPGYDASPGLVGQDRITFSNEDSVRQAISDIRNSRARISVKRTVDNVWHAVVEACDSVIVSVSRRPVPRSV